MYYTKIQAYGGKGWTFSTNSSSRYFSEKLGIKQKKLFFNTKSAFFMIPSVGNFLCRNLPYYLQRTSRPSVWGILGYNPTTSTVIGNSPPGTSPKSLSLSKNQLYLLCTIFHFSLLAAMMV